MRRRRRKGVFEKLEKFEQVYETQETFSSTALQNKLGLNEWALELGCGRGQFLTTYAKANPSKICIGVELKEEVIIKACEKASDMHLDNVQFVLGDSERFIDVFETQPISTLFIHFCDPWPKDRHAKRRLMHRRFLLRYGMVMKPGSELKFKTDNLPLFEFAQEQLAVSPFEIRSITTDLIKSLDWADNIMTEYEERYTALGQPIYGLIATRK